MSLFRLSPNIFFNNSAQAGARYDDIVVKLPVVILYGEEKDWEAGERNRVLGNKEAFGQSD